MDRYRKAFEADPEAVARWRSGEAFTPVPSRSGGRVVCALPSCAGIGYTGDPEGWPAPWQYAHLLGHSPCERGCGRTFPVKWDGTPRTHGTHLKSCTGGLS